MTADLPRFGMLLLIGALVTLAARRLRLPYAIGLVLVGLALGALPTALDLSLSKELIFSLFLPPLVFEAALQIHWPELRRDLPVVGLLATVGVLLAAAVAAVGMAWLGGWSPASALVFGPLLAATDP
ncbi:MAG: cation:proton antiporter, partial [Proteobacteria bacterium]|nr:cation:proton antiporter [Pseudomonadota bacterium]